MKIRGLLIKTVLALVLVLCAALAVSCGTDKYVVEDCHVYTAEDLILKAVSTDDIKIIYRSGTEPYIHCISGGVSNAKNSYVRFDFYPDGEDEKNFVPEFKVKDYPFVVVAYRTDIVTTDDSLAINSGMKLADGKYERFWGLKTFMKADGESHKAIYDLSTTSGYDGGSDKWDAIDSESGVKYIRIPMWAYSANLELSAAEYFDVEYIGFFRTLEDAERYNGYDNTEDKKIKVIYKGADGTVLGELEVFKGSKALIPEPPYKRGMIFKCWVDTDGREYGPDPKVETDMELTAVYENDPNADDIVEIAASSDFYGYTAKEISENGLFDYSGYSSKGIITDNGHSYLRLFTPEKGKAADGNNHTAVLKFSHAHFNIHLYPYLAISYRTNVSSSEQGVSSVGLKSAGEYSRFWGLTFDLVNDGSAAKAVVDVRNVTGGDKGVKFGSVDYDSSVSYVRLSTWIGAANKTTVKDEYFDIEYVAFFKTAEEAEAFEYTDGIFEKMTGIEEHKAFMLERDIRSFMPDEAFTHADAANTMSALGYENNIYSESAKDKMTSDEFAALIDTVKTSDNIKAEDCFKSENGTVSRAQAAKALCTALGRAAYEKSGYRVSPVGFSDVPEEHPEYAYIIEATYDHSYLKEVNGREIYTEVSEIRNYLKPVPDGLIGELNQKFADRVAQIRASESDWEVKEGGKVWYISNDGDDDNSGLSPDEPIATLKELSKRFGYSAGSAKHIAAGDVVLFRRGDEWHQKLTLKDGITYSAYGEGEKPRILGSVEADNPEQWLETDTPGVYRFAENLTASRDVGNIVLNNGQGYAHRVLKARDSDTILQAGRDHIVGNGMTQWKLDASKYSFADYKDLKKIADDIPESDLMYYHDRREGVLYMYSRNGNPGSLFDSIELCVKGNAITATSDVIIDNLFVGYTGSHGIGTGSCKNLTIRNCEIGWIGGSVQGEDEKTRFGNAVEIYGSADGYWVHDNYIYQCFDCGPTVQVGTTLTPGKKIVMKDIAFYGNALWDADLEVWITTKPENTEDTYAKIINCDLYDNYVIMSGYGFGGYNHQKNEYCSFYGAGQTDAEHIDCYVRNNYFWNIRYQLWKAVPTSMRENLGFKWVDNTVIHREDALLGALARDVYTATGGLTSYIYDETTISMLLASRCLGMNTFYSLPSIGRDIPANPMLPTPPIDEPYR